MTVRERIALIRKRQKSIGVLLLIAAVVLSTVIYLAFRSARNNNQSAMNHSEQPVSAVLLANTEVIVPGRDFYLGVRFRIAPEWHIYSKNPGDAGLPTTLELKLPSGFAAGPVLYPTPVRFNQPGDIVGYGYKKEVMLLVRVSPPPDLPLGQDITLQIHARWLSCREICILGEQHLERQLPVSLEARIPRDELFRKWMKQIPLDRSQ